MPLSYSSSGIIRAIAKEDIPQVRELMSAAGPFVSSSTDSAYWAYATLFSNTCLVLIHNRRICAVAIALLDQSRPDELYIQDVTVRPGYRNKGLATAILDELFCRAGTLGVKEVWLTAEPHNADAIALWRKLGFKNSDGDYLCGRTWIKKDFKGPGKDRAIFRKSLVDSDAGRFVELQSRVHDIGLN